MALIFDSYCIKTRKHLRNLKKQIVSEIRKKIIENTKKTELILFQKSIFYGVLKQKNYRQNSSYNPIYYYNTNSFTSLKAF